MALADTYPGDQPPSPVETGVLRLFETCLTDPAGAAQRIAFVVAAVAVVICAVAAIFGVPTGAGFAFFYAGSACVLAIAVRNRHRRLSDAR